MDEITSAPPTQPAPHAAHEVEKPLNDNPATAATSGAGGASPAPVAVLADALDYTLTVPQARELFLSRQRKVPAPRTLQGYCAEAKIAGQKIHTTTGVEWLINAASLDRFIESQQVITSAPPPLPAPHAPQQVEKPLNDAPATSAISAARGASPAPVAEAGIEMLKKEIGYLERENAILREQVTMKDDQIKQGNILTLGLQRMVQQLTGGRPNDQQGIE